ncbi:MAG: TolC family protein, partial [Muribaculaceae bacterium]|nr:TolC family protein [Muribaculaceae bacterium]
MTLNDCLLYAREHSFSNLAKQNEAKIAGADRQIGLSEMMPYVGLSANGSLSFGRNIDPGTNTYDTRQTLGSGIRLELSLPVFDGLVRLNNLKALRMAEAGKRESTLAEEDRGSMEVIRNYFNVAYCRALVKQVERQLQRDSIDLSTVRKEETLGTKSGADVA